MHLKRKRQWLKEQIGMDLDHKISQSKRDQVFSQLRVRGLSLPPVQARKLKLLWLNIKKSKEVLYRLKLKMRVL